MNKYKRNWSEWAKRFNAKEAKEGKASERKASFTFRNAAEMTEPLEVLIYGDIGECFWDESAIGSLDFALALSEIPKDREIRVRINSCGGSVFEGWSIYNLLSERRNKVVCIVDGVAASIASVIALAGRELQMNEASCLMIHNASGFCMGESEDMKQMAGVLDKLSSVIAGIYMRKTGKTAEEVKASMDSETWFTADEAKAYGLCDSIISEAKSASAQTTKPNPAGAKSNGGAISNTMNRTQVIALLNKLGLKFEDKDSDETLSALLENYTAPAPQAAAPDISSEVQKVNRITNAVQKCASELRIPGASVESFTARCLKDESFLAELQALPPRQVGAEPVTGNPPDAKANTMKLDSYNKLNDSEKKKFCLEGGKITD